MFTAWIIGLISHCSWKLSSSSLRGFLSLILHIHLVNRALHSLFYMPLKCIPSSPFLHSPSSLPYRPAGFPMPNIWVRRWFSAWFIMSSLRGHVINGMESRKDDLLCLEGVMQMVGTFRILGLSILDLYPVWLLQMGQNLNSIRWNTETSQLGPHPSSLSVLPHSQTHAVCVHHLDTLLPSAGAWFEVLSCAWSAYPHHVHPESSNPTFRIQASATLVESPATHKHPASCFTPRCRYTL